MFSLNVIFTCLATIAAVTAAPTPLEARQDDPCNIKLDPNGNYIDTGCGVVIHPRADSTVCIRTDYDTHAGNYLFVSPCVSGNVSGGRWKLNYPNQNTELRNMQSTSYDFCITSPTDGTEWATMQTCSGQTTQTWTVTDDSMIKLVDADKCLAYTDLSGDIVVRPCNKNDETQRWSFPAPQ